MQEIIKLFETNTADISDISVIFTHYTNEYKGHVICYVRGESIKTELNLLLETKPHKYSKNAIVNLSPLVRLGKSIALDALLSGDVEELSFNFVCEPTDLMQKINKFGYTLNAIDYQIVGGALKATTIAAYNFSGKRAELIATEEKVSFGRMKNPLGIRNFQIDGCAVVVVFKIQLRAAGTNTAQQHGNQADDDCNCPFTTQCISGDLSKVRCVFHR